MKVDVEGREIEVLQAVRELIRSGTRVHNIIVEFTPKWWPHGFDNGMSVIQSFLDDGWTFSASPWSEHGTRVGKRPNGLVPDGIQFDWDAEPLLMVQTVPNEKVRNVLRTLKYQRDYWLEAPNASYPMDRKANGVEDLECDDGDSFRYARLPRYLKGNALTTQCLDLYHK